MPDSLFYVEACPACQLFGHTHAAGRLRVTDFDLVEGTEKTDSIAHNAIDRLTGGAADKKLYTINYLTQASYTGQIILQNFSLWQIGWLGMLLEDLRDGLLKVGHKQTSGAGRLELKEAHGRLRLTGKRPIAGEVWGLGTLVDDDIRGEYHLVDDRLALQGLDWQSSALWTEAVLMGLEDPAHTFWQSTRSLAVQYLKQADLPFRTVADMQLEWLEELRKAMRQEVTQ